MTTAVRMAVVLQDRVEGMAEEIDSRSEFLSGST
jgi:hypothetical protein